MVQVQSQLAKRYARAVFELASEKNMLPALQADMEAIVAVLNASPAMQRALASPVLSIEASRALLGTLAKQAKMSSLTTQLFAVLVRNRRVGSLADIAATVLALLETHHNIVRADVTSAQALSAEQIRQLTQMLSDALHKTVIVDTKVDPSLLGGLVVRLGSKMWDGSLAEKINRLYHAQKQAIARLK